MSRRRSRQSSRVRTHRARHALRRAEQVAEHGNRAAARCAEIAGGLLEQQRGSARLAARDRTAPSSRASGRRPRRCAAARRRPRVARGSRAGRDRPYRGVEGAGAHHKRPRAHGRSDRAHNSERPIPMTAAMSQPTRALRRRAAHRFRHRARRLSCCRSSTAPRPPPSRGAHAGVRDQQRGPRHARGDLLLRLHAAADPGRRARRHARTAPDRDGRLARRGRRARRSSALAPTWEIAAIGRTLVGVGVSVAFIAMLKICAVWFPANRFATSSA